MAGAAVALGNTGKAKFVGCAGVTGNATTIKILKPIFFRCRIEGLVIIFLNLDRLANEEVFRAQGWELLAPLVSLPDFGFCISTAKEGNGAPATRRDVVFSSMPSVDNLPPLPP